MSLFSRLRAYPEHYITTETLIIEASLKDFKSRFPELAPQLDAAIEQGLHPKWLQWFVKNVQAGIEPEKLVRIAKTFDKLIPKMPKEQTDVGLWQKKSVQDLEQFLNDLEKGPSVSQAQNIQKAEMSGAKKLYSDSRYIAYQIVNYENARYLSAEDTLWCISQQHHFMDYSQSKFFIIFIDKKNLTPLVRVKSGTLEKWCVPRFGKVAVTLNSTSDMVIDSIWDAHDTKISRSTATQAFPCFDKVLELCKERSNPVLGPNAKKVAGGWIVPGDVTLERSAETKLPPIVSVGGSITLLNTRLKNLEGCPRTVPKDFRCLLNSNLQSLKGCPEEINGKLLLAGNGSLISLKYGPKSVGDFYDVHGNSLESLQGAPDSVTYFLCYGNRLRTLEGGPAIVRGNFHYRCDQNPLLSLKGAPVKINGDFNCSHTYLEDLTGSPRYVEGDFKCTNSELRTWKGAPDKIMGDVYFEDNPQEFYENFDEAAFRRSCEVRGKIYLD